MPPVFMVIASCRRGGGVAVPCVGEAGLCIGYAGQVECQVEGGNVDVQCGERLDAARAFEGLGGEIGAIG